MRGHAEPEWVSISFYRVMAAGDVNGDGFADLAASKAGLRVLPGSDDGLVVFGGPWRRRRGRRRLQRSVERRGNLRWGRRRADGRPPGPIDCQRCSLLDLGTGAYLLRSSEGSLLFHRVYSGDLDVDGVESSTDCDDEETSVGGPLAGLWDRDRDGWGSVMRDGCPGRPGVAALGGDCDDLDPTIHPAAPEWPGSGVDEDCDGLEYCFLDLDCDGLRGTGVEVRPSEDLDCLDTGEAVREAGFNPAEGQEPAACG